VANQNFLFGGGSGDGFRRAKEPLWEKKKTLEGTASASEKINQEDVSSTTQRSFIQGKRKRGWCLGVTSGKGEMRMFPNNKTRKKQKPCIVGDLVMADGEELPHPQNAQSNNQKGKHGGNWSYVLQRGGSIGGLDRFLWSTKGSWRKKRRGLTNQEARHHLFQKAIVLNPKGKINSWVTFWDEKGHWEVWMHVYVYFCDGHGGGAKGWNIDENGSEKGFGLKKNDKGILILNTLKGGGVVGRT